MKQRSQPLPDRNAEAGLDALAQAMVGLSRAEDVRAVLEDICMPAELEAMAYVDLNPIRAGISRRLEDSDYTSASITPNMIPPY
jgi:uncharacterized protein YerC